jgi:hypothetical protein
MLTPADVKALKADAKTMKRLDDVTELTFDQQP